MASEVSLRPEESPRFHANRPRDLHGRQPPWHRLAHITRELPRALEQLAAALQVPPSGRVLDYGCGDIPYRYFFASGVEFVAADLPGNPKAAVQIEPNGALSRLPDDSFDAILSTQVLEHVVDPETYLSECHRLLRPGGQLLLSTHGLMVYHPDPVDYWRWTCAGLREAIARAGLEVIRFEGIMGLAATGFQLIQDAWYSRLPRSIRPLLALVLQTLARLADRIEPRSSRELNSLVFAVIARKP